MPVDRSMVVPEMREAWRSFTTGVAFITTVGSRGPNVMSAEWCYNVSYEPFLISVHLDPDAATHEAIDETGEFGVNIVAEEQVAAMGFAGHFTRKETDKLSSELFETYPAKLIRPPMIRGCLLNAECRLAQKVAMGDHVAYIGEVVEFQVDPAKQPVVLHRGSRHLGQRIVRTQQVAIGATLNGRSVRIDGELTGPEREGRQVELRLLGDDGEALTSARAETDQHGYFEVDLELPTGAAPAMTRAEARAGDAVGRAKVQL